MRKLLGKNTAKHNYTDMIWDAHRVALWPRHMEYVEEPATKILMKVALRLNNQNTLRKSKELKEKKRER